MSLLWVVTFIWAFSFSIIGQYISPVIDPYLAVLCRSMIGLIIFLPFIKIFPFKLSASLMCIGGFQFGLTYIFLYQAYSYLTVPEIVLFTITTPIFVSLIGSFLHKKWHILPIISAILAVIGAFVIRYSQLSENFLMGLLLIQAANICFALGQVCYQYIANRIPHTAYHSFGYFFIGAFIVNGVAFLLLGNLAPTFDLLFLQVNSVPFSTWLALLFVGVVATGLGQFLWCLGAKSVSNGVLAVMNNAVIPIGIIVNLLFWNRSVDYQSLILGGSIMILALLLNMIPLTLLTSSGFSKKRVSAAK